jgi:peroxiredoxin
MRRLLVVAAVIIGVSFCCIFVSGQKSLSATPAPRAQGPQVGSLAPDFTLTTMRGKSVSLAQFRGKVVMLNFWATWCPPCRAEMPSIEKLYRRMKQKGNFVLLAVNVESHARNSIKDFTRQIPLEFPILLDQDHRVSSLYEVSGIPTTFLINPKGVIVKKVVGGRDWDTPEVAATLTSLMKGE